MGLSTEGWNAKKYEKKNYNGKIVFHTIWINMLL